MGRGRGQGESAEASQRTWPTASPIVADTSRTMEFKPHEKILVLSDAHGNHTKVAAALAYAAENGISHIWNLGDVYGLRHSAAGTSAWELLKASASLNLRGNHDDAAARGKVLKSYVFKKDADGIPSRKYQGEVGELKPQKLVKLANDYRVYAVHASPTDPLWDFIGNAREAKEAWASADRRGIPNIELIVSGHTHTAAIYYEQGQGGASHWLNKNLVDQTVDLAGKERLILNPGSIGDSGVFMIISLDENKHPIKVEWKQV